MIRVSVVYPRTEGESFNCLASLIWRIPSFSLHDLSALPGSSLATTSPAIFAIDSCREDSISREKDANKY